MNIKETEISLMSWKLLGSHKTISVAPKDAYGFVYVIIYTGKSNDEIHEGKFYVGKKSLEFTRRKLMTKKDKLIVENRRKKYKIETKDSGWQDYWGSSTKLITDIERYGEENFDRRILKFYPDKINLTYGEMEYQFLYDVLRTDTYNLSIGGKFFKGRIL